MAINEFLDWSTSTSSQPEQGKILSLAQYLDQVDHHRNLVDTAHQRIWRMVMAAGTQDGGGHPYPFFSQSLYGLDRAIERLVDDYFRPAALGFDVRRRIVLLVGPVGGGKSTMVSLIKRGLERFTRTTEGALYGIVGCPMHEDPVHLLSVSHRERLADQLGLSQVLEGELCPACQWRLEHEYAGRLDQFGIEPIHLSEAHRVGIGTYAPSDPRSQDISELTGAVDFAQIGSIGSESDPRAFRFDGELNIANRGLVEFQEMLKLDERFLYHLLSLSQEGNFKTGRYQLISADEVIIGHTNENEYRSFQKNPKNQALLSRMVVVPVPYNLDVNQEVRIYQKSLLAHALPGQHVSDKALEMAATIAVLSRIQDDPGPGGDRLSKLNRYRDRPLGIIGVENTGETEGFRGMDPRFVINRMAQALAHGQECVDGLDAIRTLIRGVVDDPFVDPKWRETIEECASTAESLFYQEIESEVRNALIAEGEDQLQDLYQNYVQALIDSVEQDASATSQTQERLLRTIETRLEVEESQKHQFREEMYLILAKPESVTLRTVPNSLMRAMEAKLFDDLRDEMHLSYPDHAQVGWIEHAIENLAATGAYCPRCASQAIRRLGAVYRR